ncbi:MAG: hypothetical protein A3G81_07350 [Betaproteobacteria bacterium RIFCSPLOWO2_12_FULL_65_14]|nr:MAG: hypothetical protein A3G81_07350 [Betaproteobacteria bacterium RIFCSPLOWO2_12_FULL_65_14]
MRKLTLTVGIALLAVALPAANASDDAQYEREGWAAVPVAEVERARPGTSQRVDRPRLQRAAPYEETLFDRGWPVLPERIPAADEASFGATVAPVSPFDRDYGFIAPAQ